MVRLPPGINEIVLPCVGGYTIYIDSSLTYEQREDAYRHALWHIEHGDFEKCDVQEIEHDAHRMEECG